MLKTGPCVYMLMCSDKSLYTGWTMDVNRRFKQHQQGKASKYTRARLPVELVFLEYHCDKIAAMKREWLLKTFNRKQKLSLIEGNPLPKSI
ncbi:MAG: GIY-YIG nuclease family protein [Oligoflexales bacterium]|nr:GIY-YIG nuclease family protein [Oligoflexales bacterium]